MAWHLYIEEYYLIGVMQIGNCVYALIYCVVLNLVKSTYTHPPIPTASLCSSKAVKKEEEEAETCVYSNSNGGSDRVAAAQCGCLLGAAA